MGMKLEPKAVPFAERLKLEEDDDYQISDQAWIADYDDPMTFLDLYESSSPYNTSIAGGYKNEQYDQLIDDARDEPDAAKRMDILLEAEKLLIEEDAAFAPWRFYGSAYLVDTNHHALRRSTVRRWQRLLAVETLLADQRLDSHARRKRGYSFFTGIPP